jgi:hypothetical protein
MYQIGRSSSGHHLVIMSPRLTPLKRQLNAAAQGSSSKQAALDDRWNSRNAPLTQVVSFKHPGHDVDPFRGRRFNIHHPLITESTRLYEFRPYALNKLSSGTFLWDDQSVSTLLGLVALAVFNDLNWKDDDPSSTFVYPSIVTESYYYDSELERRGVTNIDVQVDVNLLKSPNGAARTDVVFILANGDRRYGHFTLVRVKKEEKYIAVCDPYNGCLTDRLLQSCVSFIEKVYGEDSPRVVDEELRNIAPGFWKVVKETPNNQDNPSDKTACGPLCLERIIQWMSTR